MKTKELAVLDKSADSADLNSAVEFGIDISLPPDVLVGQDRNGLPRTVVQMAEALADCAEYRELPTLMAALALEAAGIPFNFTSVVTHG